MALGGAGRRSEEDGVGDGTKGTGVPRSAEELQQAIARIRGELTRLSGEIEKTANEQFEQRKPELRSSMDDLETAIDSLATRAKGFLSDLKAKLDDAGQAAGERTDLGGDPGHSSAERSGGGTEERR